jgi:hypothetical protein
VTNTDDQLVADYLGRLTAAAADLPPDRRDELIEEIRAHIAEARAAAAEGGPSGSSVRGVLDRLGSPDDIVRAAAEQSAAEGNAAGQGVPGPDFIGAGYGGYADAGYGGTGGGGTGYGGPGRPPSPSGWRAVGGRLSRPADGSGPRPGVLETIAMILLLIGGFFAGVGWLVGVILLWLSPRWRLSDKLLGTLVWPGGVASLVLLAGFGLVVPTSVSCDSAASLWGGGCAATPGLPSWLTTALLVAVAAVLIAGPILVAIRLVRQARRWPGALTASASAVRAA